MDTAKLKKFAGQARRLLIEQIGTRLDRVLTIDSSELREQESTLKELKKVLETESKSSLVERVAYIWFNRFCALRFMDVNRYTNMGILSPSKGHTQPEILHEAKQGYIDDIYKSFLGKKDIFGLLDGQIKSSDPQQEAYRGLLVAVCNYYNTIMPFMFEKIADYTELLMPEDLLSQNSILQAVIAALDEDSCQDIEVIGWLYQFYIAEKKDDVFAALKKGKKITAENIPAATQLFTPNWIVRYLVENSLGRLWMLNNPSSKLKDKMEFYIKPEQEEEGFLKISSPEELKICDPACGSGHMLVYSFDLLYQIYEEEGYDAPDIPGLILKNNLFGIEIDDRAGALSMFSLFMKARSKYKRFFSKTTQPNVCVLGNFSFEKEEIDEYFNELGSDFLSSEEIDTLHQFNDAKNFGSLIRPITGGLDEALKKLNEVDVSGKLFISQTHDKVLRVLQQADYLDSKYHVVIANPPYMGGSGMNINLKNFAKVDYPDSKSDLFAMFIKRNLELVKKHGLISMITMQSWMFLSSLEMLRTKILASNTIISMAHLGPRSFDSIGGEIVSTTAFIIENFSKLSTKGSYIRLVSGNSERDKRDALIEAVKNPNCGWFFQASSADFKKIPGSPIAYWVSAQFRRSFENSKSLKELVPIKQGMATSDNNRFLRKWHEVSFKKIAFDCKSLGESEKRNEKWYPYNKGGDFRKWYGNNEFLVNWGQNGTELRAFVDEINKLKPGGRLKNQEYYFRESVTWTDISSSSFGVRASTPGFLFDASGSCIFPAKNEAKVYTAYLCSKTAFQFLKAINPTLHFQVENISILPVHNRMLMEFSDELYKISNKCISISRQDWDNFEVSWNYTSNLLATGFKFIEESYKNNKENWNKLILELQELELNNNEIFTTIFDLKEDISSEVSISEVTLTCNPYYRYDHKKPKEELEKLLLADTMKEFLSYSVGCMFGRYSLDKPGFILANQGDTVKEYLSQVPNPTFEPDKDNVIPLLDSDWFTDDITERFRSFLKTTFGEEKYEENLTFIEEAIGKDIRKYFITDFYKEHVKMYKKRPIYWLFSSPKGSFNALIYMHRYQPDTVSIVLNDYLREFKTKLTAHQDHLKQLSISASASQKEKTKAIKELEKLKKKIDELDQYERDILYPLATKKIEIDLDDGVKVNYPKFGKALKTVPGLS